MHEAAIAQGVIDEILRLREEGAWRGRLVRAHLRIGKLTAVVPDYLAFCFAAMVEGSELEGVTLGWEDVPVRGRCLDCGETSEFATVGFLCMTCGSPQVEITAGRELLIDSLEVDEDVP
jgi:hydrogenase nickel incorporation protein HypA/HybF